MSLVKPLFYASIGRKIIMGLTGLFLCLFLVTHLAGNLLLYVNDNGVTFNHYADFMENNIVTKILEVGLFAGFFFHIIDGIVLTLRNKSARSVGYQVNRASENSRWFSRNMGFTGSIVFLFLIIHLRTFFIGQRFLHESASMYTSVRIAFADPLYSGFYVLAILFLAFHLNHGFQSAFQSLGLNHPKYTPLIKGFGALFAFIIPLGFISMPVYFYLKAAGMCP